MAKDHVFQKKLGALPLLFFCRACVAMAVSFVRFPRMATISSGKTGVASFIDQNQRPVATGFSILRYISRTLLIKKLPFLADFIKN